MLEFIVLGHVPGTDVYLSFDTIALASTPVLGALAYYLHREIAKYSKKNSFNEQTI